MAPLRIVGFFLVIVGLLGLLWGGISWTRQKTGLDVGPLEVKTEQHERIPLSPALGLVALIGGAVLLLIPQKRRA